MTNTHLAQQQREIGGDRSSTGVFGQLCPEHDYHLEPYLTAYRIMIIL